MTDHLLLVDASGFAFRAFHAAAPCYRESDGQPTGAILGFMSRVWQMLGAASADKPTHGAAVFDAPGKNFRHKLFPEYKANRDPARRIELDDQFPLMRHAAEALGLHPVEVGGFEADDVIATLAERARKAGVRCTIVSSDKDFAQLVIDGAVEIIDPLARVHIGEADVLKKFGVKPEQIQDMQALSGDTVDGIPGIPGCGKRIASSLIRTFGSVDGVLKNWDDCGYPIVRAYLKKRGKYGKTGADDVRLFLKLTTLRRNVPLDTEIASLRLEPIMKVHLMEILRVLEAPHRMEEIFRLDPQMVRVVDHVEDEFEWWREELMASGQRVPDMPQSGFYKRVLIHRGPYVGARIWREQEVDPVTGEATGKDTVRCDVGGRARDPFAEWTRLAMKPITKDEYHYEMADAEHARLYRPDDPKANPTQRPDILKAPVPQNPRHPRRKQ